MSKNKELINFGVLTDLINATEALWEEKGLNIEEKELIIKNIAARQATERQKQKSKDMMGDMMGGSPLGGLLKGFGKKDDQN